MATITHDAPTLADVAMLTDPNGAAVPVIDILSKQTPIFRDGVVTEANRGTYNETVVVTSHSDPEVSVANQGVGYATGTHSTITDGTLELVKRAKIDVRLLKGVKNPNRLRRMEAEPVIAGMGENMSSRFWYGTGGLKDVNGITTRYSDPDAENGGNILDGSGTSAKTDLTSVYLIGWGENLTKLIYPRGSRAGVQVEDLGRIQVPDDNDSTKQYTALVSEIKIALGVAVRDWRSVVRIANISIGDLTADASAGAKLHNLFIQAQGQVGNLGRGKFIMYARKEIFTWARLQFANKSNVYFTFGNVGGVPVGDFAGTPIHQDDTIKSGETYVALS